MRAAFIIGPQRGAGLRPVKYIHGEFVQPRPIHLSRAAVVALLLGGCGGHSHHQGSTHISTSPSTSVSAVGIHKITHVVVIMQENRTFDS